MNLIHVHTLTLLVLLSSATIPASSFAATPKKKPVKSTTKSAKSKTPTKTKPEAKPQQTTPSTSTPPAATSGALADPVAEPKPATTDSATPKAKEKEKEIEKEKEKEKETEKEKDKEHHAESKNKKSNAEKHPTIGIGLEFGSNATYGNALTLRYDPFSFFDIQLGAGYNTTGIKAGAGGALILPIGSRFGFDLGGAYVHSNGIQDKVSLPGKFTPADSTSSENITVTKHFKVTPANYMSFFGGAFFDLVPMFRLFGHVNYNKVISGNNVELTGTPEYDQPIDPTNESQVQDDFDPKAKSKLDINGIGFSGGFQIRF